MTYNTIINSKFRSTISGVSLVCLEKNGKDCIDYNSAFKLNLDLYLKLLLVKMERGELVPEQTENAKPMEGDFVYALGKSSLSGLWCTPNYSTPVFGWIEKDEYGQLYIQGFKLMSSTSKRGEQFMFSPQKYYLKNAQGKPSKAFVNLQILFTR